MSNTHFGFKTVAEEEKASLVRGVFNNVASRYDVMNDAMSLGLHRVWKHEFVSGIDIRPTSKCLDVAGGTGDIAFRLLGKGAANVTVCDINQAMLEEGRKRADDKNIIKNIEWTCGNAESLPFPDNSFDFYTIAFGIRNVTRIDKALQEAYRTLNYGGRFLCLEFSHVTSDLFSKIYNSYSFNIIPKLGQMIAGDRDSYQYLVESIRQFPTQDKFSDMISDAGFSRVSYKNLSGGIVAIHSGYKL
ncbi:MAG: bifunctional demethylmenaquinone methyltransferase/2-methoxy-6-polyprenyl-1,4-benzoquinol methylase UbiE [Pseudomonadota bacterium]